MAWAVIRESRSIDLDDHGVEGAAVGGGLEEVGQPTLARHRHLGRLAATATVLERLAPDSMSQ